MNSTGSGTCCGFEITGVGLLQQTDARVGAQAGIDLAVTGVHGEHAGGAVLQHAIGKAAGGGADIHADGSFERDAPVGERRLQFEASAADVTEIAAEQTDQAIVGDGVPGLVNLLLIHQDAAGENHGLGTLARRHQTTLDKKNVNSFFQDSLSFSREFAGTLSGKNGVDR